MHSSSKLDNKSKIFIVSQPFYPVPPVLDGAVPVIIQDTIDCSTNDNIKVVSIWDKRMKNIKFDKERYYFIDRYSIILRAAKRIFSKYIRSKLVYPITLTKYFDMLFGLLGYSLINKPDVLVVHSTRSEWVINLTQIFSKRNIKIAWYHHLSEDQNVDDEKLSLFPQIDAHIFVSDYSRKKFVGKVCQYDKLVADKSFVIKNGINTNFFKIYPDMRVKIRNQYQISDDEVVLLFVGKLIYRKGLHNLIDAYDLLSIDTKSKTFLLIVGSADYYKNEESSYSIELKKKAEKISNHIIFTGYTPHEEMNNYYSSADLLVFPSVEEEGMPLTILEAQAMKLPVVATNVGGIPEIITNNKTGILYDFSADPAIIAQHLDLLINDTELRRFYSEQGQENILQSFCRERMARDFEITISKVTSA